MKRIARARGGATAIEFALLAPLLMLLALGTVEFGIALNNYIVLTEAVRSGSRQLSVARETASPFTDTIGRITQSAPSLARANLRVTVSVNGTACASDTACSTALSGAQGQPATVAASYPCRLVVLGYDFAPGCTLYSTTTERIE